MARRSHTVCIVAAAAAFCAAGRAQAATLEDIYAAWRAREERVRSARFEWVETRTYSAGFLRE
jgi:hypothetical protein